MSRFEGPIRVAVLMGGPDEEHEVSLASGQAVAGALQNCEQVDVVAQVVDTPRAEELARLDVDVIFPVLHGAWGEGGGLQRELEAAGCRFVGSSSIVAAAAMNKVRTKEVAVDMGIPTPAWQVLSPGMERDITVPVVIKPPAQGSSIDLHVCTDERALDLHRADLESRYEELLVEACITGREITVGVVDDEVLPLVEIIPAEGFYDYEAKYLRDDTRYNINPDLPPPLVEACRNHALRLGRALGCRDLYRVDFIVDQQVPWMLEVNSMPGFTEHSLLPMAAQAAGRSMARLCEDLVRIAAGRAVDMASPS